MWLFYGNWGGRRAYDWLARVFTERHGIPAAAVKRMAAEDAPEGEPAAAEGAVLRKGEDGVLRTGGLEAAVAGGQAVQDRGDR